MNEERVLLGDEAVAQGAIDAGLSSAYGYPGTPSTEIMEYLLEVADKKGGFFAAWSSNEKTAYEEALGASYAGKRVLVTMKHVGLNVAADPFVNSALLDIKGGLVLAVADDPGMHSSQNEQDSRFYADFAKIICLEPRNQQEAYAMTRRAFDISEEYHVPVMLRLVTRLAHSRAIVRTGAGKEPNPREKASDVKGWMLLPATARRNWSRLLEAQKGFAALSETSPYNEERIVAPANPADSAATEPEWGVITTGLARNYYQEAAAELPLHAHLHISLYPAPEETLRRFCQKLKKVVILEEGNPFIEKQLRGIIAPELEIRGKMDGALPLTGELTPDTIRPALGLPSREGTATDFTLPGRPPQLCQGCPHGDSYFALNDAVKDYEESIVTADIGCYALGALPPYQSIETIVCMGASIGMAKGAAEAGSHPCVAVIGDSTFLHSGVTALVDAVACGTNMTVLILDNSAVAMTGGQTTILPSSALERVIAGIGVHPDHIRTFVPLKKNHDDNVRLLKEEMDYPGVSVVIALRECLETARKRKKSGAAQ